MTEFSLDRAAARYAAAKKAAATRKANREAARQKRVAAARKGVETRIANAAAKRRSEAARKGWETRRAKAAAAQSRAAIAAPEVRMSKKGQGAKAPIEDLLKGLKKAELARVAESVRAFHGNRDTKKKLIANIARVVSERAYDAQRVQVAKSLPLGGANFVASPTPEQMVAAKKAGDAAARQAEADIRKAIKNVVADPSGKPVRSSATADPAAARSQKAKPSTVSELRAQAKKAGVKGFSRMRKADLITALRTAGKARVGGSAPLALAVGVAAATYALTRGASPAQAAEVAADVGTGGGVSLYKQTRAEGGSAGFAAVRAAGNFASMGGTEIAGQARKAGYSRGASGALSIAASALNYVTFGAAGAALSSGIRRQGEIAAHVARQERLARAARSREQRAGGGAYLNSDARGKAATGKAPVTLVAQKAGRDPVSAGTVTYTTKDGRSVQLTKAQAAAARARRK